MIENVPTVLDAWASAFNAKQEEAYGHDGHCAVLAGPGSGKTRVLVAKVARLFAQRAAGPRGIACVTFNNDAVREMRKRIGEMGLRLDKRLFVGTVHSFCMACIVAPFGHLLRDDLPENLSVAGFRQREDTLQAALDVVGIGDMARHWQSQFDRYRRTHPLRESAEWNADPELARLVEVYEGLLRDQGLLDYDDMVLMALDLIHRHEFVRAGLEARFPFLVVDEYQDLGYPLHLIVRFLMQTTGIEVFAVGDPDQSIYGFAGAGPQYLRELAEDPSVRRVDLDMNYRSAQRIIDGSQVALAPDEPREYKSAREEAIGEIYFLECTDGLEQQANLIAEEVIPGLVESGVSNGQIAILYIDVADQVVLSQALDKTGIKYAGERDQRYPRTPFTRWLEDIATWCTLFPYTQEGPQLNDLLVKYAELKEGSNTPINTGDLSARTQFFEVLTSIATPSAPLDEWLKKLDSLLGLQGCLIARASSPDDLADWDHIRESCSEGKALEGFLLDDFARCGGRPDAVTLTTLHSSKGLEYEAVIMPGLEEGRLPRYDATSDDALAEARRVFYVGMTRAKDKVYMLYSGWYKNRYGRVFDHGASRFVIDLYERMAS